ncbi:hypothetical protein ABT330_06905 [Streptomyces sp. NPDC000658]|uniref:hypothetical protein n=1 Tax=Streptomyces sp. NPDC000658 TaxID=3154266 RepID=UPI00331B2B9A
MSRAKADRRSISHTVAKSRWRVSCQTRTDWMECTARIAATKRGCTVDLESGKWSAGPEEFRIAYNGVLLNATQAKQAAQSRCIPWEYAGYADIAISRMQAADALLIRLLTDEMLCGEIPRIRQTVQSYLEPQDQRRKWLDSFREQDGEAISAVDRQRIESALRGAYTANGFTRGRLRTFNNILLVAAAVLIALTVLLGVLNAHYGSRLACSGFGTKLVCPLGDKPNHSDILLIELVGATGAAVSAVYSLARAQRVEDPYMVHVGQAILKVSLGGITAILGLILLFATPGFSVTSTWQIFAFAVVFGYSQQIFTRFIDSRGDELLKAASPSGRENPSVASTRDQEE